MIPSPIHRGAAFAAAAALSIVASAAVAQQRERPRDNTPPSKERLMVPSAQARALGGAQAPSARLAGVFDAGGAPIRTKGVQSIERVDTGVYCIRPLTSSNVSTANYIATATVDYFYSELDEVTVQVFHSRTDPDCGTARIPVYTFQNPSLSGGNYVFSNNVGFSIIVP